ncbi:MAG: hypothetical protein WBB28_13005 [Crinalium sp.]
MQAPSSPTSSPQALNPVCPTVFGYFAFTTCPSYVAWFSQLIEVYKTDITLPQNQ